MVKETDQSNLEKNLDQTGAPKSAKQEQEAAPVYQMVGDTRIPVSDKLGPIWQSRKKQAEKARKDSGVSDAWEEALKYYDNDQLSHRGEGHPDRPQNMRNTKTGTDRYSSTENIVYSNTNALVPLLYAKNPVVELTTNVKNDGDREKRATMLERLANAVISKKTSPGVNLKPKAKRSVVMASLTNNAYIEVGYTNKKDSSEQAISELEDLAKKYAETKDASELREIEGKLQAIEAKVDFLTPSGPWVRTKNPNDVLVDPDSIEADFSDAKWMIIGDWMPTEKLKAIYSQEKDGRPVSIFKETHRVNLKSDEGNNSNDEDNIFSGSEHERQGFDSKDTFSKAARTRVWSVWDKTTRRVLLFNDGDWSWPLWVWNDPYRLDRFFNIYRLELAASPNGGETKGEVSYYLDQQDNINTINSQRHKAMDWVSNNIIYNKNLVTEDEAQKYVNGSDEKVLGIDLPEGAKIEDAVYSRPPPSANFAQLFNPGVEMEAVSRVSSVTQVMRGAEFKTNTTNDAVNRYNSVTQTRLDEKVDAVEDFIGDVSWGILQLCIQFMEKESVAELIGVENSEEWEQMSPEQIQGNTSLKVVGSSMTKPTSAAKKEEALNIGQVLGQFASAGPAVVITMLKVLERAFDEITITEEDWTRIIDVMEQQAQQGAPAQEGSTDGQGGTPSEGSGDVISQIVSILEGIPPQIIATIGDAVKQGVPVRDAVERIASELTSQQSA